MMLEVMKGGIPLASRGVGMIGALPCCVGLILGGEGGWSLTSRWPPGGVGSIRRSSGVHNHG